MHKEQLIKDHIAFAKHLALNHRKWTDNNKLSMEDLISEAYLGLVEAAEGWDKERGAFIPYAKKVIKSKLIQADRNHFLPSSVASAQPYIILRDIRRAVNDGVDENPQAIADALNINVKKILELWNYYKNNGYHANIIVDDKEDNPVNNIASNDSVEEEVINGLLKSDVRAALNKMPTKFREILEYRFGFKTGEPMLSNEICEKLKMTNKEFIEAEKTAVKYFKKYWEQ